MQSLALVTRINVLTAIRDHDLQTEAVFREALGFEGASDDLLVERGRRYDARALLAYAHGKATGDFLDPDRVPLSALKVLTDLGFTVTTRAELERAKAAPAARKRTAGTAAPRAPRAPRATATAKAPARPEPVIRLCPTCFTQLSVTGTCGFCD